MHRQLEDGHALISTAWWSRSVPLSLEAWGANAHDPAGPRLRRLGATTRIRRSSVGFAGQWHSVDLDPGRPLGAAGRARPNCPVGVVGQSGLDGVVAPEDGRLIQAQFKTSMIASTKWVR